MATKSQPNLPFAAYSGKEPFVFVSYGHDDAETVFPELKWMKEQGFNIWYDEGISPGHTWHDELASKIDSCGLFLFFVSPRSVQSRNCLRETAFAVSKDKEFLAIHLEETELPSGLALEIGDRQAILKNLFEPDIYQGKVFEALSHYLSASPTSTTTEPAAPAVQSAPETVTTYRTETRWTPFRKITAALIAITAIGLIASQWLLPTSAPELAVAELDDAPNPLLQLRQLIEQEDYDAAFLLAEQLESQSAGDPALAELWPQFSERGSVLTEPSAAKAWVKSYESPAAEWIYLGETPLTDVRFPGGYLRLKFEKDGHEPVEIVSLNPSIFFGNSAQFPGIGPNPFQLPSAGVPQDMTYVPAGNVGPAIAGFGTDRIYWGPFLIDKYEVSNRAYKEFVDQGGYQNEEYWADLEFEDDGSSISREQAQQRFVDSTGRPGPANWELGNYATGLDNYPVTGISWYEAVAYARFRGKELPTVYHWARAAYDHGFFNAGIISLANYSGSPTELGTSQSVSPYGNYDMAGNAREWVWNQTGSNRWTLGGAWNDPAYMSSLPYNLPPLTRDDVTGFRLARYIDESSIRDELLQPLDMTLRDFTTETPVSDEVYAVLEEQFSYDRGNLAPVVERIDDSNPNWTKEKIVLNTGYDSERFAVYLFTPKTSGPHEAVVHFPGLSQFNSLQSSEELQPGYLDFIISSGRALVWPVYSGSFERYDGINELSDEARVNIYRQRALRWRSDLGRSLDYLQTRDDIAGDSFAYLGFSYGASFAITLLALEDRIDAAVLLIGGFTFREYPTIADPLNYVSRITQPVLMLNGRFDYLFPVEQRQIPFYNLLGTADADKRHVLYDMGHAIPPRNELVTETVAWLDKYLGTSE